MSETLLNDLRLHTVGLALVRSIVQLSGGRLGVRSRRGEGSCFWVELPFAIVSRVQYRVELILT